jgi:hypothetical protein
MQWAAMKPLPPVRRTFILSVLEVEKCRRKFVDCVASACGRLEVGDLSGLK